MGIPNIQIKNARAAQEAERWRAKLGYGSLAKVVETFFLERAAQLEQREEREAGEQPPLRMTK